jgi:TetR/AcrR family transcriptional regulator, mexJK operon transcriptional repressor
VPRLAGQIDKAKNEAILDAASAVLFERGLAAPLDQIARRAGVSKQTIYNHYGSKAELVRALIERRSRMVNASLEAPLAQAFPEEALAAWARAVLTTVTMERSVSLFRLLIQSVPTMPELARMAFEAAIRSGRVRLAEFLAREARAGRLAIDDATQAASFFAGMVVSHHQIQGLFGIPSDLTPEAIDRIAREAAKRFMRAYGR